MKATDIINFINEDKFSKYTVKQIYDELGPEEFINYIENLVYRIAKSGKIPTLKLDEKQFTPPKVSIRFRGKNNTFLYVSYVDISEVLMLRCFSGDPHKKRRMEFVSDFFVLPKDTVNILPELQKLILRSFTDLAKERADIHI